MTPQLTALVNNMARDIQEDVKRAGFPITDAVALHCATMHVQKGKDEAMKVLVDFGVPMTRKSTSGGEGLGGKVTSITYSVGKHSIFIGY